MVSLSTKVAIALRRMFGPLAVVVGVVLPAGAAELLPAERPISEVIDYYIDQELSAEEITPAPRASDANLVRRLTLDLVGRIPTVVEAQAFVASDDPNKSEQLVDRLLASPEFVEHQANEFDTLLINGNSGSLRDYLLKAFQERRPWDQMFRDMLLGRDDVPEQKGANQFIKARVKDLDKLTGESSAIFFGVNISCAQCHDHPLVTDWKQDHFFGLKSFFSRTFENGGFVGEQEYGVVQFKPRQGPERVAKLMFLTGTVVDEPEVKEPSAQDKKKDSERLKELAAKKEPPPEPKFSRRAQLVDVSLRPETRDFFARSIVNRLWHRLYGYGLVMPVDQMHSENPPSHPELLAWLARDLIEHQYDLPRLIRGLALSATYARNSRWDGPTMSPGERPAAKLFAVAMVRPLSPQQYAASLRLASTDPDQFPADMKPEEFARKISGLTSTARGMASRFPVPTDNFQVSVNESLMFSNSDKMMNELFAGGDRLLARLQKMDDRRSAIEMAIWSILSRPAEDEEAFLLNEYLQKHASQGTESYRNLLWALLTSSEFRFNY